MGSGRVDSGSLAGKESARVLSSIFSRVARTLPMSVGRSSGSLVAFFMEGTKSSYVSLASCAILSSMTSFSLGSSRRSRAQGRAILRQRAKSGLDTDEFPQIVTGVGEHHAR